MLKAIRGPVPSRNLLRKHGDTFRREIEGTRSPIRRPETFGLVLRFNMKKLKEARSRYEAIT